MRGVIRVVALMVVTGALLLPAAASAQQIVPDSGDTAWMLGAFALVLLTVLPGLALYYVGRAATPRAATAAGLGVFAIVATVSLLWVLIGYSLTFSPTGSAYIGDGFNAMFANLSMVRGSTTIPESAFALFHMGLACFAAALAAGGDIGRARIGWLIAFAALWTLIVYAPIAHWMWGGGWLAAMGAVDFAGGAVVHCAAGVSALVVALLAGKDVESADDNADPPLAYGRVALLAGVGMMWAGWSGLVGGSQLAATDNAAMAILNMHVAAGAATLAWAALEKLRNSKPNIPSIMIGTLAGLASMTAGAIYIGPVAAMLVGAIGACACFFAGGWLSRHLGHSNGNIIFAINGVGGMTGMLLTAIFVAPVLGGTGYMGHMGIAGQLAAQAIAVGVTVGWAALGAWICALCASFVSHVHDDE